MYKQLTLIAFLLILSVPGLAVSTTIFVNATQDVTIHPDGFFHGNDTALQFQKLGTYVQYNVSNASNWIWTNIYPNFYRTEAFCSTGGGCIRWLYYVPNNSWSENALNFTIQPNLTNVELAGLWGHGTGLGSYLGSYGIMTNSNPQLSPPFKTRENTSNVIGAMHRNEIVTFFISTGFSSPGATSTGTNGSVSSKEGGFPPYLRFTASDYTNGSANWTNLAGFVGFDFDTFYLNTSNWGYADFIYISSINSLISNNANNITIAVADVSTGLENDIDTRIQKCPTISSYSYTQQFPNPYPGYYNYYCFNLSALHGGRAFYGMIKVINNSNVIGNSSPEFGFYWGQMSPLYLTFTPPILSPNPPQIGLNLSVQTSTNRLIGNAIMYFQYNSSGNLSVIQGANDINGDGNRVVHNFVINSQAVVTGTYRVYFTGIDLTNNQVITSATYTFNVSLPLNAQVNNSILPTAIDRLVSGGVVANPTEGLWLFGSIILVMGTLFAYLFAGGIKVAIVTAVSLIAVLGLMGFLPYFVIVPIIVIVVLLIGKAILGMFGHGGFN